MVMEFAAGAAALVALALCFVLPVLWTRARTTALVLLAGLPLGAVGLYYTFGTPEALDPARLVAPATIDEAIDQLQERLDEAPDNIDGWVLLGRTRKTQGREAEAQQRSDAAGPYFASAQQAFLRAMALAPDDPDLQVETAEAMSLADPGRRFQPEAVALLDRALATNPQQQRALWFRGIAALQAGDAAGAASRWEALLPQVDASTAESLRPQIAEARSAAGLPPLAAAAVAPTGPGISLRIDADPALVASMPEGAVLFVFARSAEQPASPPVAARRIPSPRFPLELRLSDADSLMPTATLSATGRVELQARFARSGSVEAQQGDLIAAPVAAAVGTSAEPVVLTLRAEP